MKNKLIMGIYTIIISVLCICNYTYAEESNTLLSGTEYSLTIPAASYKAYVYYPEYTGSYMINATSDSIFECDILNSNYYEKHTSSFNLTQTLYENEVCCFSFHNSNSFDITITFSIYPEFLPAN